MFDWFSLSYPTYMFYALCLPVQQTEGDGLWWWGWWITLKSSPGTRQDNRRGYAILGLIISCIFDKRVPVSWILGCHTSFCVSLETTHQQRKTMTWSWHYGVTGGRGGSRTHTIKKGVLLWLIFNDIATKSHCLCCTSDTSWHCWLNSYFPFISPWLTSVHRTWKPR